MKRYLPSLLTVFLTLRYLGGIEQSAKDIH